MKKETRILIISIAAPFIAGAIGSFFTSPAIQDWYTYLNQPSWTPPNWLFGPVWSLLYFLMGAALYFVWREALHGEHGPWWRRLWERLHSSERVELARAGVEVFFVHLVLNALWSIVFFGAQQPAWAFGVIVVLWILIGIMISLFWRVKKISAVLLVPYLAWVSFAAALNLAIVMLN